MSEDIQKIKDRIAKLLAMAADTSSPEEAAIAAGRARKLMDKYQLESWECEKDIKEKFDDKAATRNYASMPIFLSTLSVSVARFNDCQARAVTGFMDYKMDAKRNQNDGRAPKQFGSHIRFYGYESDVQMACDMFDKLIGAMNNQCKAYLLPFGYAKYPVKVGTAFKSYFCQALIDRINAMTKDRDELLIGSVSGSTSLVVVKAKTVADHFGEVHYRKAEYRSDLSDTSIGDAARAGKAAGERQTIIEEVADNSAAPKRLAQ